LPRSFSGGPVSISLPDSHNPSVRPLSVIELCLSPGRGGLEYYAAGLVPALAAREHSVAVVARPDSEFARLAGRTPALAIRGSRRAPLRGARRLARLARTADVIHIHRSADLPLAAAAKRLAGGRPALVYTRHMAITRDRRASPVHRWLHGQVDLLLTITETLAAQARERLPIDPERVRALPPGVEETTGTTDCAQVRPARTAFVAGCFSRVEPAKGQHDLIEAVGRLAASGVDAGAVIAGPVMEVAYAERLRARVHELGLDERIRFLGALADAPAAMACCDVVVLPSASETLGLVLVEAMLRGVPVVGTAAGGVPEIITAGETGLTYPAGDEAALTQRLALLAGDPELARGLSRAGRAAARERFERGRHLDRLEALLAAAAGRRTGAAG